MPHCAFGFPPRVDIKVTRLLELFSDSVMLLFHQLARLESVLAACQFSTLKSHELSEHEFGTGVVFGELIEETTGAGLGELTEETIGSIGVVVEMVTQAADVVFCVVITTGAVVGIRIGKAVVAYVM